MNEEVNSIAIVLNVKLGLSQDEVVSYLDGVLPELLAVLKENKFPFPEDTVPDDDLMWIDDDYADWIDELEDEEGTGDFD